MVWLSLGLWAKSAKNVKTISKRMRHQFVDTLRLTCKGGHGGNGVPKYGGIGGQGGCVYFVATEDMTLEKLMKKHPDKRIAAGHGEDSSKLRLLGRRGVDRRIEVPSGVALLHEGRCIGELNEPDATCVVAGGGIGGCTSNSFLGHAGESKTISLDLKLIADVGLVGFPNAGKSTLLKAISNASPKIASYPFTTIRPQIGTVNYPDLRQITVADLPGLIEGAHANIGMGHKFLKHVERTRLLLMVVDVHGFRLSPKHAQRSCVENVLALAKELELYDETLLGKPCVLLVNKIDTLGLEEQQQQQLDSGETTDAAQQQVDPSSVAGLEATARNAREVRELVQRLWRLDEQQADCPEELRSTRLPQFERIIAISAQQQTNIAEAKRAIREVLDESAERELLANEGKATEERKTNASVHRKLKQ